MTETLSIETLKNQYENLAYDEPVTTYEQLLKEVDQLKEHAETLSQEDQIELYRLGGQLNLDLEHYREALPYYRKVAQLSRDNNAPKTEADALQKTGIIKFRIQDLQGALSTYQAAITIYENNKGLEKEHAECLQDIGFIYQEAQDFNTALNYFAKSLKIGQDINDENTQVTALSNSSLIAYQTQGRQAAIEFLKQSLADYGLNHYILLNNLGFMLMLEKNYDEARGFISQGIEDCEARSEEDQDSTASLLNLNHAILETVQENYEAGSTYYEKAHQLFEQEDEDRAIEILLLAMDEKSQESFESILITENANKLAITDANHAVAQFHLGNNDKALALMDEAIEHDPNSSYVYLAKGWLLAQMGQQEEALTLFNKALRMHPGNTLYQETVKHFNPYAFQKVNRNDPCPCNSGKKFKKCHGAQR